MFSLFLCVVRYHQQAEVVCAYRVHIFYSMFFSFVVDFSVFGVYTERETTEFLVFFADVAELRVVSCLNSSIVAHT